MRVCHITLAVCAYGVVASQLAWAQEGRQVPELSVGRLADGERPSIDGLVSDAIWSSAQPFSAFIQQEPDEGQPATERTEIRFLRDRENLYIGVINFDSEPDNLSAPLSASLLHRVGSYYDGDYHGWQLTVGMRAGARLLSEIGWSRDDITLPGGRFRNDLVPVKVSYAFTSLASLQGLIQYNKQASTFSSNIRLALLDRSGTGFFVVYNDRRDTSAFTPDERLGQSFIVKYTRLFDY